MKWRKIGKIFSVDRANIDWMNSHASVPFVDYIGDCKYKIYFSTRDKQNRSNTAYVIIDIRDPVNILEVSKKPVIKPGEIGEFDDSGAMGSCIVNVYDNKYIYYIGWNLGVTVPFRNSIGLAVSKDSGDSFEKFSNGPIIDRNFKEPHFTASSCVILDEGIFKIWYLSCVKWEIINNEPRHFYHIKYAESEDGVNWVRDGKVAIDFKDAYEYAISVPRVIKEDGLYKMWFSSRAEKGISTYRIRYAESVDGTEWNRKDSGIGINVSESGWDSEMICYPSIFKHNEKKYMLYNGNGFGQTGFGLAVLEEE
jgi:hypothetical protein